MAQDLADLAPARLVPVLRDSDGVVIGDSLAMAETLAERHPEACLWPKGTAARAFARWMVAEMHSGFTELRGECPMQLQHQITNFVPSQAVLNDLARIEELWSLARNRFGANVPVSDLAKSYVTTTLADPEFRAWRTVGRKISYEPFPYHADKTTAPWPGPD